jgi:SAM-dependent methyltransferase
MNRVDEEWNRVWQKRGRDYHQASIQFPKAHLREIDLFVSGFKLKAGMTALEVAAAGGYILERVRKAVGESAKLLAIEPSDTFAQFLPSYVQRIPNSTITEFDLLDESVDLAANLAGLHHTKDNGLFFKECRRVLRSGGTCGVCDVRKGSCVSTWLNEFVNRYNSHGHTGWFFEEGEMSDKMKTVGFKNVREQRMVYTWDFDSMDEMVVFCKLLFGLDRASADEIKKGVETILGFARADDAEVAVNWELIHAFGEKD